jgi:hypothetical protein
MESEKNATKYLLAFSAQLNILTIPSATLPYLCGYWTIYLDVQYRKNLVFFFWMVQELEF